MGVSTAQLCPGMTYKDILTKGDVKDRIGVTGNISVPRYFNPAAFCAPSTVAGTTNGTAFGTTGIGIVLGPGQFNTDFSITKLTRIG
jgi:hypothetical protein